MTSIAYKDGVLAADGRMTQGSVISTDTAVKIRKLPSKINYQDDLLIYIACAGVISDLDKVLAEISGDDTDGDTEHDISGIFLGEKYNYLLEPGSLWLIRMNKKEMLAVGSGTPHLYTAMRLGFGAKQAVVAACKSDCYSGGKIQTIKDPHFKGKGK